MYNASHIQLHFVVAVIIQDKEAGEMNVNNLFNPVSRKMLGLHVIYIKILKVLYF